MWGLSGELSSAHLLMNLMMHLTQERIASAISVGNLFALAKRSCANIKELC